MANVNSVSLSSLGQAGKHKLSNFLLLSPTQQLHEKLRKESNKLFRIHSNINFPRF
jgi:hypothetical protein